MTALSHYHTMAAPSYREDITTKLVTTTHADDKSLIIYLDP